MDVLGLWKAGKIISPNEEATCFITIDEFCALPEDAKDDLMEHFAKSFMEFKPDGTMQLFFVIPEDEVESAREDGFEVLDGNRVLLNTFSWKDENGIIYYSCDEFDIYDMPTQFDDDGGMIVVDTIIYYKQ